MSAELACTCGNNLRVTEAHIGRKVKCPTCGAELVVPESIAIRERPGPMVVASGGRNRTTILLLMLALLLIAGGLAGWWVYHRGTEPAGPDISDLSLIPENAQGFVSVRLADIWQTPACQQAVKEERDRDPKKP